MGVFLWFLLNSVLARSLPLHGRNEDHELCGECPDEATTESKAGQLRDLGAKRSFLLCFFWFLAFGLLVLGLFFFFLGGGFWVFFLLFVGLPKQMMIGRSDLPGGRFCFSKNRPSRWESAKKKKRQSLPTLVLASKFFPSLQHKKSCS